MDIEQATFRCDDAAGFELRVLRAQDSDFHVSVVPRQDDMESNGLDPENYARCFGASVRVRVPMIGGGAHERLWHALASLFSGRTVSRRVRQVKVLQWVLDTFGPKNALVGERAARFVEEAVELAQACDVTRAQVDRILDVVYSRPPGRIGQEIGGVGITLLALAEATDVDADEAEAFEVDRVLAKPAGHWRRRHMEKAEQGIAIPPDIQ